MKKFLREIKKREEIELKPIKMGLSVTIKSVLSLLIPHH